MLQISSYTWAKKTVFEKKDLMSLRHWCMLKRCRRTPVKLAVQDHWNGLVCLQRQQSEKKRITFEKQHVEAIVWSPNTLLRLFESDCRYLSKVCVFSRCGSNSALLCGMSDHLRILHMWYNVTFWFRLAKIQVGGGGVCQTNRTRAICTLLPHLVPVRTHSSRRISCNPPFQTEDDNETQSYN